MAWWLPLNLDLCENLGGVRIEDMVVINDDTPMVLTKSSKELIVL